jgi:hypothetical protein
MAQRAGPPYWRDALRSFAWTLLGFLAMLGLAAVVLVVYGVLV